jgi:peptidoglycan/xylan/chitin deacetylase (PgdA/CDA1 family)
MKYIKTVSMSLPILTFHSLDDLGSVISFPPRVFRYGLARLHEEGYRTISLFEAVEYLRQGKPFPIRSFTITFDDGYQVVYDEAFPLLQRYNMSATVFLTVGERKTEKPTGRLPSLQGRSMLSWLEMQEMQRCGISFGAHALTHVDLTCLPSHQAEAQVCHSKAIIEEILGIPISCFAYPYGRYNDTLRELVQRHFTCACSDKLGLVHSHSNPFILERVEMYYFRTPQLFSMILTKFLPWYLFVRKVPRSVKHFFSLNEIQFNH